MENMSLKLFLLCLLFNSLSGFGVVGVSPRNKRSLATLATNFEAIYQFGDSLSDTGNYVRQPGANLIYNNLPYGESYHPTGRASDGLLIVDNIAKYFQLPLLNPYLATGSDFTNGANFAIIGGTANGGLGDDSLAKQLDWFKNHLNSAFSNDPTAIKEKLQKSLILMGEIGGNDFNGPFFQGKSIPDVTQLIPGVLKTIKDAVEEVIILGANNIVVPGNFAIGCVPIYLAKFETDDSSKYDELECLKDYNAFAADYNEQLIQVIQQLQDDHPDVAIVYADYYNALTSIIKQAPQLGIAPDDTKKACCGSGNNPYNCGGQSCGTPGAPVCKDPSARLNWDGIHMTQQGYKYVADSLLKQIVPKLRKHHLLKRRSQKTNDKH